MPPRHYYVPAECPTSGGAGMNTDVFVEVIEEMPIDVVKDNFEALFVLALSIEDGEQEQGEE